MKKQNMSNVNKTLYIPLYGKSLVSKRGLFLQDPMAQRIWESEQFALKGKSKSKYLAFYMGIRAAVFDEWVKARIREADDAVIIAVGCGMDSRAQRVDQNVLWYDVDFPEVIAQRRRYYKETERYCMLSGDARDPAWLLQIPQRKHAIVVLEGVSMYLTTQEKQHLFEAVGNRFERVSVLMDVYSEFAAKMSKYKNPINDVGVTTVYGTDDPAALQTEQVRFVREHDMIPRAYVDQLQGMEKQIFARLYAGGFAKTLYRLYEYQKS